MLKRLIVSKRKTAKVFSIILLIAFLVSVFLFQGFYITQVNKVRGMYSVWKGDKALRKLKLQKAIDYYQKGLALYPGHYSAWFNLGNIYVVYEDYYSAVDAYENAIKYNPNYVIARMNYGIVSAEKLGDFDGAISQYKTILDIRRKLVYIPFVFNNLRSYKTNIGLAYYNMGLAYRKKSLYMDEDIAYQERYLNDAIDAYKHAAKILKKSYDARYNLALAYHLYGDYRNAGISYCKAIELAPMNYEAHYNLAILLRHMKFYKESIDEMEKATTLITSTDGSTNRQSYVFDVLNDVSRMYIDKGAMNAMIEPLDTNKRTSEQKYVPMTYVNGRLVFTDELDKAIINNFKTCSSMHIFTDDEEEEFYSSADRHFPGD